MNENDFASENSALTEKRKTWKAIAIAVLLVIAVVALLWGWKTSRSGGAGWHSPSAIDVVAANVVSEAAPVRLEALGEVRAVRQVTLSSEISGRIALLSFQPGQRVNRGVVLVQLDDSVEQADLAAAKAKVMFAQQQFDRASQLAATGATSREVLQQRKSERDQSAAQVQQLEARILQKRIRAPFDGELGLRRVDLGQYVNAGDQVVTLTDLETVYVNFDLPQQELRKVAVGQAVEIHSDAPDTGVLQARISAIEPQVGRDTRNATVQAMLMNEGNMLRPGMYVNASVVLPPEADALLLPATAIMTSASGSSAAVIRELSAEKIGKIGIVPVVVSRRIDDRVVITGGLKAGDIVVTEGQVRLQPNVAVHVVDKTAQGQDKQLRQAPLPGEYK